MKKSTFLTEAEESRIVERIADLEHHCTGEIRVHTASKVSRKGIMADAKDTFAALGMVSTDARNGVLIYIAAEQHEFAIVGDEGIHAKVGQEGWNHAAHTMSEHFKAGRYVEGILAALDEVGAVLTREFPLVEGQLNTNELPNHLTHT